MFPVASALICVSFPDALLTTPPHYLKMQNRYFHAHPVGDGGQQRESSGSLVQKCMEKKLSKN